MFQNTVNVTVDQLAAAFACDTFEEAKVVLGFDDGEDLVRCTKEDVPATDPIAEAKATMNRCWAHYDEAMKHGEDAELDTDYFEAETLLKNVSKQTVITPPSYPDTPFVFWVWNGVEQVIAFANADDAKLAEQALRAAGFAAGFSIPKGYKEIPFKRYAGDGLLNEDELVALKAKLDKMTLVH